MINRRSVLTGLIAAPAIVKVSALMPLPRAPWPPLRRVGDSLVCNGALVNVADYPELFAVVGHAWGAAPGRFRLPDLGASVIKPLHYLINAAPRWDAPVGALSLWGLPA